MSTLVLGQEQACFHGTGLFLRRAGLLLRSRLVSTEQAYISIKSVLVFKNEKTCPLWATVKLRVVYDGLAKLKPDDVSINDCLDQGPNYIPKLFDVLVKFRSHHVPLTVDIEKPFLMVGISESDRDMLRFLWFDEPENLNSKISCFRFTRLAFGLCPSPEILGSLITQHLNTYKNASPKLIKLIEDSMYVDDLISGAENDRKAFDVYQGSKTILAEGSFHLCKWHSNSSELTKRIGSAKSTENMAMIPENEATRKSIVEEDQTYSKASVGVDNNEKEDYIVKVIRVKWDCKSDELCFDLSSVIDYAKASSNAKIST